MTELHRLDPEKILTTSKTLERRIEERFEDSGLSKVCARLVELAGHARETTAQLARPNLKLRILSYAVIVAIVAASVAGMVMAVRHGRQAGTIGWADVVQLAEAGVNDLVLLGAAIFFFVSFEARMKRARVVNALHDLRSLAHLVDVHQLAKNPETFGGELAPTASSPSRRLTPEQMARYLDYSSEMLSLTGKVAALYGEGFADSEAIKAVNDVEELCIGLQRKIWQKIIILEGRVAGRGPALAPAREEEGV